MSSSPNGRRWTRHFIYRTESVRTTWKFRIAILAIIVTAAWLTSGRWTVAVARGLACEENAAPSDAILVENFDPDYLVFERASQLRRAGLALRVLVPISTDRQTSEVNDVALGMAEVMARISKLGAFEIVPIREAEPISLNAARDVRSFIERENIKSVIIVTPLFRSRRSSLVYNAAFGGAHIAVTCAPVFGSRDIVTWTRTWHGIQNVSEQWLKLQYYRFYVLPFLLRANGPG